MLVGRGMERGVERAVEQAVEQAVVEGVQGVEQETGQVQLSQHLEAQAFQMASTSVKPMGRSFLRVGSACSEVGMEQGQYLAWPYCRDWQLRCRWNSEIH